MGAGEAVAACNKQNGRTMPNNFQNRRLFAKYGPRDHLPSTHEYVREREREKEKNSSHLRADLLISDPQLENSTALTSSLRLLSSVS